MNNKFKTVFVEKLKKPCAIAIGTGMCIAALTSCANAAPAEPSYAIVCEEVPGNGGGNVPVGDVNEENNREQQVNNNVDSSGEGWTLSGNILTIDGVSADVSLILNYVPDSRNQILSFDLLAGTIAGNPDETLLEFRITDASHQFFAYEIDWESGGAIRTQSAFPR